MCSDAPVYSELSDCWWGMEVNATTAGSALNSLLMLINDSYCININDNSTSQYEI